MNKTITTFGRVSVTDEGIEINYGVMAPYFIASGRLWEYSDRFENYLVWDWPIHLIEKTWLTREDMLNFNNAFFFARDYFKGLKPSNIPENVSTAQTLFVQDQMKTNHDNISKIPTPENGISIFDKSPEQEEWEAKCFEVRRPLEFLSI